MAVRVTHENETVSVPTWVSDLEPFRRWADHDDFPEKGRITWLAGDKWVDTSMEQLFTHNGVKAALNAVLWAIVDGERLGCYFTDGAYISNEAGDVSNQPDGMYVSERSLADGRVRIIEGRDEGFVELEGTPDMVAEIVSRSSVGKDTVALRAAYALAGIPEYWLIDARKPPIRFDILRLRGGTYRPVRKRSGWARSEAFGLWFRLNQTEGGRGLPRYCLEHRTERP